MLDRHLAANRRLCSGSHAVASIAARPRYGAPVANKVYDAAVFLDAASYGHVLRWSAKVAAAEEWRGRVRLPRT